MRILFLGTVSPDTARHGVRSIVVDGRLLIGLAPDFRADAVLDDPVVLNDLKLSPFQTIETGFHTLTPLLARPGGLIYLIERDGKVFLCGNNSGYFPEKTWDYLAGKVIHAVSLDCVSSDMWEKPGFQTEEDVLTTRRRLYQLGCVEPAVRFYVSSPEGGMDELKERMSTRGVTVAHAGLTAEL